MFEDIFNDGVEELYACEAAVDVANFYGFDLAACYEADESGAAPDKEGAWKKFKTLVKDKAKAVADKIRQFCTFVARKVRELFFKITKKETFYLSAKKAKHGNAVISSASKVYALATKGLTMPKTNESAIIATKEQIDNLVTKTLDPNLDAFDKAENEAPYQVFKNIPFDEKAMQAEIDQLSKDADAYEKDVDALPSGGNKTIHTALPAIMRTKVKAINAKLKVLTLYAGAPATMPKKAEADK